MGGHGLLAKCHCQSHGQSIIVAWVVSQSVSQSVSHVVIACIVTPREGGYLVLYTSRKGEGGIF